MISSKLKNKLLVERWFYSKYGRKFSRYHSRSIKFYLSSKSYEVSYEMPCNVCFVARAPCARTWISRSRSAEMSRRTPISSTPPSSEWQLLLSLQPSTTISNVICVCTFHRRIVPNSLDQSFGLDVYLFWNETLCLWILRFGQQSIGLTMLSKKRNDGYPRNRVPKISVENAEFVFRR